MDQISNTLQDSASSLLQEFSISNTSGTSVGGIDSVSNDLTGYSPYSYTGTISNISSYSSRPVASLTLDLEDLRVKDDYGNLVPFKDWLKNYIKEVILNDFLGAQKLELEILKKEIADLKTLMEDVFQDAAVTKLEALAKKD